MKRTPLALVKWLAPIVFFIALPSLAASAANRASFVKTDIVTLGSWAGAYGSDGAFISQDPATKMPAYASLAFSGQSDWTWDTPTTHLQALQKAENPSERIAGQWFANGSFQIDVNVMDGGPHQVSLYLLDWDRNMRAETVNVKDPTTGNVLDSRIVPAGNAFCQGLYLVWNIQGHVTFEFVRNAGANATLSGVFFDPEASANTSSIRASSANDFLNSLGVTGGFRPMPRMESLFQYTGIRNYRIGVEHVETLVALHKNSIIPGVYPGVRFNILGSNIPEHVENGVTLAKADALLSFEGPNEPNNFPITYNNATGGKDHSWVPVAQYQRDLYAAVKANPTVKDYPVFSVSESGAESENVGLQYLTIPAGAATLMPGGTHYADYVNVHNYVTGNGYCATLHDNQAWDAADPTLNSCWDGLYVEHGVTWLKRFQGYSDDALVTLPRVTTETGWGTDATSEENQARVLLNMYLSQFKRGWTHSFLYEFYDFAGGVPGGFGIFSKDLKPKKSATYIHNMTTILADVVSRPPESLIYSILARPITVHDLLLEKSDRTFYLIIWDERVPGSGTDDITVELGKPFASVKVYDPTVGINAMQSLINITRLSLTLSDHPLILAISNP